MSHCLRVFMWLMVLSTLLSVTCGFADKIYLKDGTVEVAERVWQSDKYVHFILRGTTDVTIRYAKTIVERVLIDGVEVVVSPSAPATQKSTPVQVQPGPLTAEKEATIQKDATKTTTPHQTEKKLITQTKPAIKLNRMDQKKVGMQKGISFYDPRRDLRYWASRKSKHNTLSAALGALAKMYGQSVSWVETYMGAENDLGIIHQNLMANQGETIKAAVEEVAVRRPPTGLFYNQGKSSPYRIGPNKVFKSQAAAVEALARQYGRSTAWVQEHFGQSNELETIHANLKNAMQQTAAPKKEEAIALMPTGKPLAKGNEFYNPRRKKKYWIGGTERYNSLDDALGALAKKYGVSVELIERYMGNTNDLKQIHENIRTNLN